MSLSSLRLSAASFTFHHRHTNPSLFTSRRLAPPHFRALTVNPLISGRNSRLRVYDSGDLVRRNEPRSFNFDSLLSIAELACLVSSAIGAIGFANWKKAVLGERVLVWGLVAMVGGVLIGALIRRRQWSRICVQSVEGGVESFNLVDRVEKLEQDLKSSTAIVRALARQLEKLGLRFRVTRKSLKDPIAETAALAQKNSEATRALAMQEDILEKEIGEIHNVLLAMQEQQHKQLDLIIAIGKAGKLLNDEERPEQEHDRKQKHQTDHSVKQTDAKGKPQPERVEPMETSSPPRQAFDKAKK